ncbi:hypothetical protein K1719_047430 [Acacia pycnantha]|nr:hypothetical protein K1719_047430 [Acacia pycnantha]
MAVTKDAIAHFDWSSFILQELCEEIHEFKKDSQKSKRKQSKTVGDCLYFLMLFCFQNFPLGDVIPSQHESPMAFWTDEKVKSKVLVEKRSKKGLLVRVKPRQPLPQASVPPSTSFDPDTILTHPVVRTTYARLLSNLQQEMLALQHTLSEEGQHEDFAKVLNPGDGVCADYSNPLCPKFTFEEKERERLMKPFSCTLGVKLLGRQLSYGFMARKLKQIWERKGKIDVFDLENDFYLVNFQHGGDYMEALIGGPWVISDAYLSVGRWRPDFNPKVERIESVVAWVRFPDLPAPFFDKKFLLNLGNSIGKAIRLDVHTAQRTRGRL